MGNTLQGKVAIVTGAGRGIGRGVALKLADEGAWVLVNDLGVAVDGTGADRMAADLVVGEIRERNGAAIASYANVASMQAGQGMTDAVLQEWGRLDIVVCVAGILRDRMVYNLSEKDWDDVLNVHLKGTFSLVKSAATVFRQQRSGRIITFSSESGLLGNPGQAAYGAAKSGICGFTKNVAREVGPYGVTANCIVPRAYTRMLQGVPPEAHLFLERLHIQGLPFDPASPEAQAWHPDDVAPFVAFLSSDYAANINGCTFLVYGDTIGLFQDPRPLSTIYKGEGFFTLEELAAIVPGTLGRGLANPAPAQVSK
ncbi:MAG: SDR family oxidoreductase [Chloroflexi bacterium]|nr:SDR family oxidoreductase [Chloroflexota bacterium]